MIQMLRASQSGQKAGRRTLRLPAQLISAAPSTKPRPTRELEARVPAPAPVTFCLGLWRHARRSPVRWWLQRWAFPPNESKSQWMATWIFEARLAYQETCPSALKAFVSILTLLHLKQQQNNSADCERKRNSIA